MLAGTFTILARDPGSDQLGLAVQSKFLAVGAAVPSARAGVGVAASQAWSNPTYGPRALALLAEGRSPRETVAQLVGEDDERTCGRSG